ncbi:MAG: IS630 family transposase [Clostridiales bacterium]|nr:IS630 family transposase [Clostridiales bacterium]
MDLRKVTAEQLYFVRKQVVRLKQKGVPAKEIEENTGVLENQVSRIWRAYQKGGMASLKPKTRGRKEGEHRKLNAGQEKRVRKTIVDKTPDQMKFAFALWTLAAIRQLAKREYGIDLPERSVLNYLKRWGFACQRPTEKAYSQDDVAVKRFMEDEYPKIAKRAKTEGAEICWGDETGVNNQEYYARGYSPKGQAPVAPSISKREKVNMISAVNNQGKTRFMVYDDNMNQDKLIRFMRRLTKDAGRKVFLILGNLEVHHGKKVQEWLKKHREEIEVFFLPPYSPELNPDEYLNHNLKRSVHSGTLPRTKKEIHHKVESFMRKMQHNKRSIENIFKHKKLGYIALAD